MRPSLILLMVSSAAGQSPQVCAPCHPRQTEAFRKSPMGLSLSNEVGTARPAQFTHSASGTTFAVTGRQHSAQRSGLEATHSIAFTIGSGSHAQGFAVSMGDRFFQSPVAAYRDHAWNVAPGYETMLAPDFNRAITAECLLCHSSGGSTRQSITCDRCHGDASVHLGKHTRQTIVNPARLPPAERDSVCEQCHLNGEARVPNPGKDFSSFQPGQKLEDAFSVFVYNRASVDLKVVSHTEQLSLSRCQIATGKLWCGGCHQVHAEPISVSVQCSGCHASLSAKHPPPAARCESCHMPRRPARDGGHTAFTDHRIQKSPAVSGSTAATLRAWRETSSSAVNQRNLGLALLQTGERDGSEQFLNRGHQLLAEVFPKFSKDPEVLAGLGMVLFLKNQLADSEKLLRAAIALRPQDAGLQEKLGVVLKTMGDVPRSAIAFEKAISLDPSREASYHQLADLQTSAAKRRAILERYLRFNPQSLIAREAIAKLPRP